VNNRYKHKHGEEGNQNEEKHLLGARRKRITGMMIIQVLPTRIRTETTSRVRRQEII
jgi:hypothetical protein